ncbi:peptide deformylase [Candidatus Vidania fulgoroideae]|uniref:Peptide deformylase n=1 Tax=Candidatus Vidania fulgoroideorum TaxID=881286 RepID=A0A975AE22_9PROT|nr:peptide deformylase [Candidatus Vidania fulgoroideae]
MKILYPNKILLQKAHTIKHNDNIKPLIKIMKSTLLAHKGIGLAATQIGILKKLIILKVKKKLITIINPKIIYKSIEMFTSYEGCLSIPNHYKMVKRHKYIKIKGKTIYTTIKLTIKNNISACVQHEIDHLNGKLILKRT